MTPEEELRQLNKLIRQYETVYRTATDEEQRGRVGKELKKLRSYRDKILAVNVIDGKDLEEQAETQDDLDDYPLLKKLLDEKDAAEAARRVVEPDEDAVELSPAEREVSRVALYLEFFQLEYIPFLTEMRLKLDFKFSMERDGFYGRIQDLERKIADYRDEVARLAEGGFKKEMETEVRKRTLKLKRILEAEASRFFRAVKSFTVELVEDAHADGVKCLNADQVISFDKIEGRRLLAGRTVVSALEELGVFAAEVIEFLNIPDIESQENERADRY